VRKERYTFTLSNEFLEYLRDVEPEEYQKHVEAERLFKLEASMLMDDFKKVARTPEGIRVFRFIFDYLGLMSPCFTGNSKTYYNLGRHEAAQEIYSVLVSADPRSAQQVLLEGYRQLVRQKILTKGNENVGRNGG
jgi:hypothetical protein